MTAPTYKPDDPRITWIEPCACADGDHAAWAERDPEGFTAHLATVYRHDRKGRAA